LQGWLIQTECFRAVRHARQRRRVVLRLVRQGLLRDKPCEGPNGTGLWEFPRGSWRCVEQRGGVLPLRRPEHARSKHPCSVPGLPGRLRPEPLTVGGLTLRSEDSASRLNVPLAER